MSKITGNTARDIAVDFIISRGAAGARHAEIVKHIIMMHPEMVRDDGSVSGTVRGIMVDLEITRPAIRRPGERGLYVARDVVAPVTTLPIAVQAAPVAMPDDDAEAYDYGAPFHGGHAGSNVPPTDPVEAEARTAAIVARADREFDEQERASAAFHARLAALPAVALPKPAKAPRKRKLDTAFIR